MVIAAAAGVVLGEPCAELLRREPCVIYLRARPDTLRGRIGSGQVAAATPLTWPCQARHRERDDAYRRLAVATIDVDDLDPEQVAEAAMAVARSRPIARPGSPGNQSAPSVVPRP